MWKYTFSSKHRLRKMELVTGLSLSLFGGSGYGYSYRSPQPPVVVNILPPPCNCGACRGRKKKKKKIKKKKKLYPEVGRWYPRLTNTNDYDRYLEPRPSLAAAGKRCHYSEDQAQVYATATGARGNNTSTYCRRTRQVYESEEEIDEEESDDEEESEESDDESEESDDEEEEDDSDSEETVHQLPAGRRRGRPEEHLRSRRAYY